MISDVRISDGPTGTERVASVLERIALLAQVVFSVSFVQVIRFSDGDGVAADPVSVGHLTGKTPDLRLLCAALPPEAALVVVEDAQKDARQLNGLPEKTGFFALVRVEAANGRALGALCIADKSPGVFPSHKAERLADLAALTRMAIEAEAFEVLELQLQESESRFMALSETVFSALLITEEGTILDANEQAAELIGIDNPELLIGRHVTDLVPEEKIDIVQGQLGVSGRYEVPVVHASGHEILVEVQATTFPHAGRILRVAAIRPV